MDSYRNLERLYKLERYTTTMKEIILKTKKSRTSLENSTKVIKVMKNVMEY